MQHFVGTKVLKARPMTLGQYNDYRGWEIPADEDPSTEGYLVEYTDGGKPNHPDHRGYISWSPKAQFDSAYVSMGDYAYDLLPAHLTRLAAERAQTADRLAKLKAFIDLQTAHHSLDDEVDDPLREKLKSVPKLPQADWRLLVEQSLIMTQLLAVLDKRLQRATANSAELMGFSIDSIARSVLQVDLDPTDPDPVGTVASIAKTYQAQIERVTVEIPLVNGSTTDVMTQVLRSFAPDVTQCYTGVITDVDPNSWSLYNHKDGDSPRLSVTKPGRQFLVRIRTYNGDAVVTIDPERGTASVNHTFPDDERVLTLGLELTDHDLRLVKA